MWACLPNAPNLATLVNQMPATADSGLHKHSEYISLRDEITLGVSSSKIESLLGSVIIKKENAGELTHTTRWMYYETNLGLSLYKGFGSVSSWRRFNHVIDSAR